MPTPIIPSKFRVLLQGYDKQLATYIIDGFTHGFRIHAINIKDYCQSPTNAAIANCNPAAVEEKLMKEIKLGHIAGPFEQPPFDPMYISPLSLRPKNNNDGWRLLHDLSFPYNDKSVNSAIPDEYKHVHYASIQDAITKIQALGHNTFLAKSDIASAFTLIPISPSDYHLLGFRWNDSYYHYTTLPQGAASSCLIFERIATALEWILTTKFHIQHVVHYLDDFLFLSTTHQLCKQDMKTFQHVCQYVGIPINHNKTEGPATTLSFLGIQLDTLSFSASLPIDKVTRYTNLMTELLRRKTCTLREMQNIIGSLQFTTSVVRPGRTFLRRLINSTIGIEKPYHHIHITRPLKADLNIWLQFLQHFNGVSLFLPVAPTTSAQLNLHTDSCPQGYGGTFKSKYFLGTFPSEWQGFNICVLELFPILLALKLFRADMSNKNIIIFSDNIAVVDVLNHQTTKEPLMLSLLRVLVLHCLQHNILITSRHISGKLNVLPDALSRSIHTPSMLQDMSMDPLPTHIPEDLLPHNFKW